MRRGAIGLLAAWLLAVAIAHVVAFVWVWQFFIESKRGQQWDYLALSGNSIGQSQVEGPVNLVLNAMSLGSLVVATVVIGFIALMRGRIALAVVVTCLIVGANTTTQLLKHSIVRPDLDVDSVRAAAGNSLPSGHTAVAASVAVALVLVLPPRARGVGAVIAAGYTALAGVATLSAGWHRPSDAVAAMLVVGAWAAIAGILLRLLRRREEFVKLTEAHRFAVAFLAGTGVLLLAAALAALLLNLDVVGTQPEELGRRRLFAAYAGGAAAIAGTACLMMASVLATVHRVVPKAGGRSQAEPVRAPEPPPDPAGRSSAPDPPDPAGRSSYTGPTGSRA